MANLPKHVIFNEQGNAYALNMASMAYQGGMNPVAIQGSQFIQFCKETEKLLKANFPIEKITGTKTRLVVHFRFPTNTGNGFNRQAQRRRRRY